MSTPSANDIFFTAEILYTGTAVRMALSHFSTMMGCEYSHLSQVAFLGVLTAMVNDCLLLWSVWIFTPVCSPFQTDMLEYPDQLLVFHPYKKLMEDVIGALGLFRGRFPDIIPEDLFNDLDGCLSGLHSHGMCLFLTFYFANTFLHFCRAAFPCWYLGLSLVWLGWRGDSCSIRSEVRCSAMGGWQCLLSDLGDYSLAQA